jgi:hypothetical protein
MKNIRVVLIALVALLSIKSSFASSLLMCGGPQVVEAEVVLSGGKPTLHEIWHWRPDQSAGLPSAMMRKFITTDDCKAVSGGTEVLITSSGDVVALVSHVTGNTLFYATVKNAHSAELLPGGLIAVASSSDPGGDGDRVLLFDRHKSEKPVGYLPLEAAHGVVWDSKRNVLWALGDKQLMRLRLDVTGSAPHFVVLQHVPLPSSEGHDLQLADDGSTLYVTTAKTVFSVDSESLSFKPFEPFLGISRIKSLSMNAQTKQIAYTQADSGVWWTYMLRFLNPDQQIVLPSMIYKVRWF